MQPDLAMASKRAFYYGAGGIALAAGEEEAEEGCRRRIFGSPAVRPAVTQQFFPTTAAEQQQAMVAADKWARPPPPPPPPPPSRKSRRGPRSRSSQYRGVTYYRRTGRWESHIWDCGKQVYLGGFDTAHAAARAYDQAAIKFRGVDADINFILDDYKEDIKKMNSFSKEEYVQVLRRLGAGSVRAGSRFRGVTLHKCGKWEAKIGQLMGKKFVYLGLYDTEMDAARAYDEAAIKCRGEEAVTSFEPMALDGELNLQAWGCSEPDLELSLCCSGGGSGSGGIDALCGGSPGDRRTGLTLKMPKEEEAAAACHLCRSNAWTRPSSTQARSLHGDDHHHSISSSSSSWKMLQMGQIGDREGTSAAEPPHVRAATATATATATAGAWPWLHADAAAAAAAASSGFPPGR